MSESIPDASKSTTVPNVLAWRALALGLIAAALSALLILTARSLYLSWNLHILSQLVAYTALIVGIIALLRRGQKRIALVGILLAVSAVLAPRLWFGNDPSPRVTKAKTEAAKATLVILNMELARFAKDNGRLPTSAEGLNALVNCPPGLGATWRGPYVATEATEDRWGHSLIYRIPGKVHPTGYDLFSIGRDGEPDTSDDITNP